MNARVLILAAGQSSRMGKVKALLPLPGGAGRECPALEGLARLFHTVGIEHISVVTGWHADSVEQAAQRIGLAVVRNPRPEDGMFSSVCVGLQALADGNSALPQAPVLVLPVDVPLVRPMTVQALLKLMTLILSPFLYLSLPMQKGIRRFCPPAIWTTYGGMRSPMVKTACGVRWKGCRCAEYQWQTN